MFLRTCFLLSLLRLLWAADLYSPQRQVQEQVEERKEKKFFIYEWPRALRDVYPPPGAELHPTASYDHDFYENDGFGKTLDREQGLFSTWQFSLFKNLMARLRVSEHRTLDSKKASIFIIPYDMGVHSFIDHKNGKVRLASPHGWEAIRQLRREKRVNKHVWKNRGHDHFAIFSLIGFQYVGIGTKTFFQRICNNCSALTIETTPFHIAQPGRSRKYWYAVPYPSSFHWCEGIQAYPWQMQGQGARDITAIFIGSVKTKTPRSTQLRRQLQQDCSRAGNKLCQWYTTAHSCTGIQGNVSSPVLLYKRSTFCLAPTGDSFTRKSLFDSYLAGCIPVIFARLTLGMYMWHLTTEEIEATSVYIPRADVVDKKMNFMDVLSQISGDQILNMQKEIERIGFKLQYSVVPDEYRESTSNIELLNSIEMRKTWRPPQADAVDIIIERLLNKETIEPITGFSDETFEKLQDGQLDFMRSEWLATKATNNLVQKKIKEITG